MSRHAVPSAEATSPGRHAAHWVAPSAGETVPSGQGWHCARE